MATSAVNTNSKQYDTMSPSKPSSNSTRSTHLYMTESGLVVDEDDIRKNRADGMLGNYLPIDSSESSESSDSSSNCGDAANRLRDDFEGWNDKMQLADGSATPLPVTTVCSDTSSDCSENQLRDEFEGWNDGRPAQQSAPAPQSTLSKPDQSVRFILPEPKVFDWQPSRPATPHPPQTLGKSRFQDDLLCDHSVRISAETRRAPEPRFSDSDESDSDNDETKASYWLRGFTETDCIIRWNNAVRPGKPMEAGVPPLRGCLKKAKEVVIAKSAAASWTQIFGGKRSAGNASSKSGHGPKDEARKKSKVNPSTTGRMHRCWEGQYQAEMGLRMGTSIGLRA